PSTTQTTSTTEQNPPTTEIPYYHLKVVEDTDSPMADPVYTGEEHEAPKTPPAEGGEEDLMQDIREVLQNPNPQLQQARQAQLVNTGQPESPTTRVSTGAWALPKLPESVKSTSVENPSGVTQESPKTPGTSDG